MKNNSTNHSDENEDALAIAAAIYECLPEEKREEAKNCKNLGELMELAEKSGPKKLSDDELENVAGGYRYDGTDDYAIQVIDDHDGKVRARFRYANKPSQLKRLLGVYTKDEAWALAEIECDRLGLNKKKICWDEVESLRKKQILIPVNVNDYLIVLLPKSIDLSYKHNEEVACK